MAFLVSVALSDMHLLQHTELRIEAVAASAAVDVGTMARRAYDKDSFNPDVLRNQREAAAKNHNSDVGAEKVPIVHMLPEMYDLKI